MNTLTTATPASSRHVAESTATGMVFRRGRHAAVPDGVIRSRLRRLPGAPALYRAAMTVVAGTAPATTTREDS
jgi:hypothetical protein